MSDAPVPPPAGILSAGPSRRDFAFGGAMALAAVAAVAGRPRHRTVSIGPAELDRIAPDRIGPWRFQSASGLVLPPPDQLAQLAYDQQVTRTYVSDRDLPIMLLMAYGSSQQGVMQVHRPEICYPASGFALSGTRAAMLPLGGGRSLPVRRFTATADTRVEQVTYWTRIGDMLPVSWGAQRLAVVRSNLAGDIPDGLLVRISSISTDVDAAQAAILRFTRQLLADVSPAGRRMLIGAL